MKRFAKVLLLITVLTIFLFSCSADCTGEHADENGDGLCDLCEAEIPNDANDLVLIENGEVKFRIVEGADLDSDSRKHIAKFVSGMAKIGLEVESLEYSSTPSDDVTEVLVGSVTTRGDAYCLDTHTLGENGYAIKAIGNKIIIIGGSAEKTAEALNLFFTDFIGFTKDTESIERVVISGDMWRELPQTEFELSSVTVTGEDIRGYCITATSDTKPYERAAMLIQTSLYSRAGIWLDIVPFEKKTEKAIIIKDVNIGEAGSEGFRAFVNGNDLIIECAHDNRLEEAIEEFVRIEFHTKDKTDFKANYSFKYTISKIYYEDFGAVGDGKTNDYAAIRAAHIEANNGGQKVFGKPGAVYLISSTAVDGDRCESIPIETDTDWQGAKFIFDDRYIVHSNKEDSVGNTHVFEIKSSNSIHVTHAQLAAVNINGGITYRTKNIGTSFECDVMLTVYNSDHRVYVRYGGNQNDGSVQHEVLYVHKNGDIDPSTPLLFEYPNVTSISAIRLDEKPITVENATVESLGNRTNVYGGGSAYLKRGILVTRANTTLKNIVHVITGEIPMGTPMNASTGEIAEGYKYNGSYTDKGKGSIINKATGEKVTDGSIVPFLGYAFDGFINVHSTANVDVLNCIFQGRTYYLAGTYDISVYNSNDVVFKDCDQSNFWATDSQGRKSLNISGYPCWGVAGTNHSKNLVYDHSRLTRFDAHCGVVNGKIINGSEVATIRLTGGGEFLIEDSVLYFNGGAGVILMREDYGSTFKGTVIFKNSEIVGLNGKIPKHLFRAYSANHDFGYTTYFPNVIIDNLVIKGKTDGLNLLYVNSYNPNAEFPYRGISDPNIHIDGAVCVDGKENVNPYTPPQFIEVKNNDQNGYTVYVVNYPFFDNTELRGVEKRDP